MIIMITAIVFGPLSVQILFLIISCTSLYEFYKLIEGNVQPQLIPGITIGALAYLYISQVISLGSGFIFAVYAGVALLFIIELYRNKKIPFTNVGFTAMGIIYIVIPFAILIKLAFLSGQYSFVLPLGFFILLWCSDTFAYLSGMALGKHRLFERISPKKSWEGSIGGTLAALIAAYILFRTMGEYALQDWIIMALIIVVTGTFGDLVESMLKRSLDKKDSGNILPGHGGLLDRFDGLFISVPFVAFYFWLIGKL